MQISCWVTNEHSHSFTLPMESVKASYCIKSLINHNFIVRFFSPSLQIAKLRVNWESAIVVLTGHLVNSLKPLKEKSPKRSWPFTVQMVSDFFIFFVKKDIHSCFVGGKFDCHYSLSLTVFFQFIFSTYIHGINRVFIVFSCWLSPTPKKG